MAVHDLLHSECALFALFDNGIPTICYDKFKIVDEGTYADAGCNYIFQVCLSISVGEQDEDSARKWCRLTLQWWMVRVIKIFFHKFEGECTLCFDFSMRKLRDWETEFQQTRPSLDE